LYFRLAPAPERPLKPGEGRTAAAGPAAPAGAGAPHPPMELPEDIKQYMAGLQKDADAKPKDVGAWSTLARVYYRASRLDPSYSTKAEDAFEHVLQIEPDNLEGIRGLANIAYDHQDRPKAIEFYQKYLAKKPDDPEVRTDMGTMYFESGQADRAIAEYEKVIEQSPSFFQAYFNLAVVYDAQGDRTKARTQLEKARDLATDDNVKQRISALLAAAADGKSLAEAADAIAAAAPPKAAPPAAGGGAPPAQVAAAGGAAPAAGAPAAGSGAGGAASFPASVEQLFRNHPIAGPKIVSIEWPASDRGRIVLRNFPMDAMPEAMRASYLDKMKRGVEDAKARFSVTQSVKVELVDEASGRVMASVDS